MATELEVKLVVEDLQLLDCILCDVTVREKMAKPFCYLPMQTTYFDTPDGALSARRWMLRVRQEGETSVVTMKTATEGYVRGEWNVEAETLEDALEPLVSLGAPEALRELAAQTPVPVCGAKFTRILAELRFPDGSLCELAGDVGELLGAGKRLPLCELELELKQGEPEQMLAFSRELADRYALREQPLSKFARARALTQE